jgi:hypothetical protein
MTNMKHDYTTQGGLLTSTRSKWVMSDCPRMGACRWLNQVSMLDEYMSPLIGAYVWSPPSPSAECGSPSKSKQSATQVQSEVMVVHYGSPWYASLH